MGNTKGVSETNDSQKVKPNYRYRSYDEATRATIKSYINSLQECVGVTQSQEVLGRNHRTVLPRATEFSYITSETGAV